ncbi:hypothetical protein [Leptolyngbya sp. KIOST-1]|uniref:hypothetical protein n=1 Tax=Leptolyngbya sp. KIOST-1 TaxID=1229172 RepID=UPI00056D1421|nr:hypothetical protein [Leptolyngbya sp. KIOST-1]
MVQIRVNHDKLAKALNVSDIDFFILLLVINLIKTFGHRYGKVIDAVSVAAKFAVYLTYLEEGNNLRRTGFLHHVEPRRVKEIVSEFDTLLENGGSLCLLGSVEPSYLIGFSYIWIEKYSLKEGESVTRLFNLTESERIIIEAGFPENTPKCLLLRECDVEALIKDLHDKAQSLLHESKRTAFSEALAEHAKYRLLAAETMQEIKITKDTSAYLLLKKDYSPKGRQARMQTMIQDLTRSFRWMYSWVDGEDGIMRGIETLEIAEEQKEEALQELDQMMRAWADKYHTESDGSKIVALQFLLGPHQEMTI